MPSENEALPLPSPLKDAPATPAILSPTCGREHADPTSFSEHGVCLECQGPIPAALAPTLPASAYLTPAENPDVEVEAGTIFVSFGPARARLRIGMGVPEAHNLSDVLAMAAQATRPPLPPIDPEHLPDPEVAPAPRAPYYELDNAEQAGKLFPGVPSYELSAPRCEMERLRGWAAAAGNAGAAILAFVFGEVPKEGEQASLSVARTLIVEPKAFAARVLRAAAQAQAQLQGEPVGSAELRQASPGGTLQPMAAPRGRA